MKVNVNLRNRSAKAIVPKKVAEALDYHINELWKHLDQQTIDFMFMYIISTNVSGKSLILKEFARENSSLYLQAISNGYEPSIDIAEEVEQLLTLWLAKEYVGDEKTDVKNFAKVITNHIKSQL